MKNIPYLLNLLRLYINTIRYLKPIQIYYRPFKTVKLPRLPVKIVREPLRGIVGWGPAVDKKQVLFETNCFRFLNESAYLTECGWEGGQISKLWRYNQHYFDDLNAENADDRTHEHRELIKHWIKSNPIGSTIGWDAYPTSLRIVNWIKHHLTGKLLDDHSTNSLFFQCVWLSRNLEWHLLGNHLFSNAKALVFGGIFFSGKRADRWLEQGLKIIEAELKEQLLNDGAHFELTPMYHAIFIEDILDLLNLFQCYRSGRINALSGIIKSSVPKMLQWLEHLTHPDEKFARFNDCADNVAPSLGQLVEYANRLGIFYNAGNSGRDGFDYFHMENSGYVRVNTGDAVAILDVGRIGPSYLPGHAHADTLSFELSIQGQRVFLNTGTSTYEPGHVRKYERGTSAHNTVQIDCEDSSEVWAAFRVARRALPRGLRFAQYSDCIDIVCAHDGYARLPDCPLHERQWSFARKSVRIRDTIKPYRPLAFARYHFHPEVTVEVLSEGKYTAFDCRTGNIYCIDVISSRHFIEKTYYSPEFGIRTPSETLVVCFDDSCEIEVQVSWKGEHD